MSEIRAIRYSGIHSSNGDQINANSVTRAIENHGLQAMTLTRGRDDLGRVELTAQSTHVSGSEKVALFLQSNFFHNGLEYKSYVGISAYGFTRPQDCQEAEAVAHDEVERDLHALPGAGAPLFDRVYLGDINGDRLPDLLVVMENGAGLVMYQERP